MNTNTKTVKGFTLIELLVVIGILAVLSVVIILTLNPAELLKQARDSTRISDLSTVRTAISLYQVDAVGPALLGDSANCYVSLPSVTGLNGSGCGLAAGLNMRRFLSSPTDPPPNAPAIPNKTDGNGWVPINIAGITTGSGGAPISNLPLDPVNSTAVASGTGGAVIGAYYAYRAGNANATTCSDGGCTVYEINAFLESAKFAPKMVNDGGDANELYEVGTDPGLNL